jgi:hypothetical protein
MARLVLAERAAAAKIGLLDGMSTASTCWSNMSMITDLIDISLERVDVVNKSHEPPTDGEERLAPDIRGARARLGASCFRRFARARRPGRSLSCGQAPDPAGRSTRPPPQHQSITIRVPVPVIRHRRPMPCDANKVRVVACVPTIDSVDLCKTPHRFQSLIIDAADYLGRTRYHADGVDVATR